jgi:hypothetical protein
MKTIQTKSDCTLGFVEDSGPIKEIQKVRDILSKHLFIGKLSEITEEQAKELVYGHPEDYEKSPEYGKSGLNKLALSVGILETDFDKYLVVKL